MWPIRDETIALESFFSWSNLVFAVMWNTISALEQFFHIVIETTITIEIAF